MSEDFRDCALEEACAAGINVGVDLLDDCPLDLITSAENCLFSDEGNGLL